MPFRDARFDLVGHLTNEKLVRPVSIFSMSRSMLQCRFTKRMPTIHQLPQVCVSKSDNRNMRDRSYTSNGSINRLKGDTLVNSQNGQDALTIFMLVMIRLFHSFITYRVAQNFIIIWFKTERSVDKNDGRNCFQGGGYSFLSRHMLLALK